MVCRHPDFLHERAGWGCDGPTEEAWGSIECHGCADEPRTLYRQYCKTCDGEQVLELYECPNKMVGAYEQAVLRWATLIDKGIWPWPDLEPGDCPASLFDAIVHVLAAKVRIEAEAIEKARSRGKS